MSKIYEIFGTDAHAMTYSLLKAISAASLIPSKDASIALKPNLVVAGTPETGATTHSGVLSGCISYLQEYGFSKICVIEGSWVGDNTINAMHTCNYDDICDQYKVPFFDLKYDKTRSVKTPLRTMDICCKALDADFLINLPVLKGHCQTAMTCALKNCKGCLPDREKRRFHAEGLMHPIAALAATLHPDLTIVDSICGDLNFEEGGNPIHTNCMFLGTDPVQIDTYACQLMGLSIDDVPYIRFAEQWGAGSTKLSPEDILMLNKPENSKSYISPTGVVKQLTRNVKEKGACSACYAALVRGLYTSHFSSSRQEKIAIGQGWRGEPLPGLLGFGNCCSGADKCVRGCPPTGKDAVEFFSNF